MRVLLLSVALCLLPSIAFPQEEARLTQDLPDTPLISKAYLELGVGAAFVTSAANHMSGNGPMGSAGMTFITRHNLAIGVRAHVASFLDTHPKIEGGFFFGSYDIPPRHIIKEYAFLVGKSFPVRDEFVLLVQGGPAYARLKEPVNIHVASSNGPFIFYGPRYEYTIIRKGNLGFTVNTSLQWHNLSKLLGLGLGTYFHINANPRLRQGGVQLLFPIGKLR